jgi:hypothetical protein
MISLRTTSHRLTAEVISVMLTRQLVVIPIFYPEIGSVKFRFCWLGRTTCNEGSFYYIGNNVSFICKL